MENKIVIGLAGQIASGKDTIADYIVSKYGGVSVSFSQPLRDMLNRVFLPINRENMVWLAQTLIDRFGNDVLSKVIGEEITQSDKKIFILPNVRREGDVSCFENWPGFVLIGVKTDMRVSYERLIKRNQNTDDKEKTWEEFQRDLGLSTEVEINQLVKKSSIVIDNNASFEDLYREIDRVMAKIKHS